MNTGRGTEGFTIIEVLIVLSIGAFLFIAAAATFSGDQHQTEFDTAARQIFSQLQSISSDVQNGNYASTTSYSCTSSSGTLSFSTLQASQGTNFGCVYVGKALQFNLSASTSTYYVYSLVGDQFTTGTLSPPPAFPSSSTVLNSTPTAGMTYPPPGTQIVTLPDQFVVSKITYSGNPTQDTNDVIGFYNQQSSSLSTNSALNNQVFVIPELSNVSSQKVVTDLNADVTGVSTGQYSTTITSVVTVCFISALEPKQAVDIAFNNQSNSTNLTLNYSYNGC
jgi:prepilin-type N-terminal cleavage/methylation domain-containing protein